jgi:dUTP pyrophosphatase
VYMKLQFKQLHPDAKLPSYGHSTDAGMDLYTLEEIVFQPGEQKIIPTGLAMNLPVGYAALVWDKGSTAFNKGLKSLGGVFDAGYIGEIKISLINLSHTIQIIEKGAKCAQLVVQKVEYCDIEFTDTLIDSSRGEGGFGSTGKF